MKMDMNRAVSEAVWMPRSNGSFGSCGKPALMHWVTATRLGLYTKVVSNAFRILVSRAFRILVYLMLGTV